MRNLIIFATVAIRLEVALAGRSKGKDCSVGAASTHQSDGGGGGGDCTGIDRNSPDGRIGETERPETVGLWQLIALCLA